MTQCSYVAHVRKSAGTEKPVWSFDIVETDDEGRENIGLTICGYDSRAICETAAALQLRDYASGCGLLIF